MAKNNWSLTRFRGLRGVVSKDVTLSTAEKEAGIA